MSVFRAHRGRTSRAFRAHKPATHRTFTRAHGIRALRVPRPKRAKPAKATKPKTTPYRSLLKKPPAAWNKPPRVAPYKPVTPPVVAAAAIKKARVKARRPR